MSEAQRCRLMERGPDGKPTFRYSKDTDLAAKFARIKREMQKQAAPVNVTPIRKAKP